MNDQCGPAPGNKSLLLLFFRKEERIFFLERKKQRTFNSPVLCPV
jgi:hypothetical protein